MRKLWIVPILLAALIAVGCRSPSDDVETVAPTVISTSPADLAIDVSVSGNVTATFSEEMDSATITAANFTLMQGVTPIAGVVTYAGSVATFDPASSLAYSTVFTATVSTAAKDLVGNALAADKVWTFTTGTMPDTVAPTVSSTNPAASATGVAIGADVTATFSEAMKASTINGTNFTLMQGATPVPGTVSYVGTVATFNPSANFATSTVYTATISTGVMDLADNALAAALVWSFTTAAETVPPTVSSTSPADLGTGVAITANVTATFSEPMAAATIVAANFTLKQGLTPVLGAVSYAGNIATFNPTLNLTASTVYTATVTTAVTDLAGNALATNKVWTFTTAAPLPAGPAIVNLGTSGDFVALAKAGISTTGTTAIVGDIGVSPAAATFITGFDLILDASTEFATSALITGSVYAADYAPPTPAKMTTAIGDMELAYTDAAGRTLPDATELFAGDLSGQTIPAGLYKWGTGVMLADGAAVTLQGGANDVWIFQIAQDLTIGNGAMVTLSGGALPKNIFWQVAGQTTLGTTADFKGIILCQTLISMNTGAVLNGRALAQTAITMDANALTEPAP